MGSLCPLPNEEPKFTQIYFVDDYDVQAARHLQNIPSLQKHVVFDLKVHAPCLQQLCAELQKCT